MLQYVYLFQTGSAEGPGVKNPMLVAVKGYTYADMPFFIRAIVVMTFESVTMLFNY